MRPQLSICRMSLILVLSLLPATVTAPCASQAATLWYVAPGGNDGNGCSSPSTPCATINAAITRAASGDTINVAGGTYGGTGNEVVRLDKSVTLFGGWDDSFGLRDAASVIDGAGMRFGVTVDAAVVAVLDGFTVQNCATAGISNAGTLTVVACDIRNNAGRGIYNGWGTVSVDHSRVRDNVYGAEGTGLENWGGTMTIDHSLISGNVFYDPEHGGGGGGAGIMNDGYDGRLVIRNSTISDNQIVGSYQGSAIYSSAGGTSVVIVSSTISGNQGPASSIYGVVTLYDIRSSTITANSGGLANLASHTRLQNTILVGNGELDCYNDSAYPSGIVASLGYNLIGSQVGCSTDSTDIVGATQLELLTAGDGASLPTRALVPPSPAINGGNPGGCTDDQGNVLASDERGLPRFGRCDIGAYELQPLGFTVKTSGAPIVEPRQSLTYTIALRNDGLIDIPSVRVTDTLPISLTYTLGSLAATSGVVGYADGVITWAGTVSAGKAINVTFEASAGPECGAIHNQAIIAGAGEIYTRTATTQVSYRTFLPTISRAGSLLNANDLQDPRKYSHPGQ